MPLFEKLTFPKNAEIVNKKLQNFATFSWIPTETINTYLYDLPKQGEPDPFDKFAQYDYTSTLLIVNMG